MNDRRVLITGGSGLLGSHLTEELLNRGADVTLLIRDWIPESRLFREAITNPCNIVRGDVRDYDVIARILNEYDITHVFHLAAQTQVTYANRSPLETFDTNVMGTAILLEAVRNASWVQKIVVASSDKAYGNAEAPYKESTPLQGRYPYDCSKSCADLISQSFLETYSIPVVITRCANLFGEGDLNWNRLIPSTIRSIVTGEPVTLRSDGKMVREFLYVKDAVSAYLTLADSDQTGTFNIGYNQQYSVLEVVSFIASLMNYHGKVETLNSAKNEILVQGMDSSKFMNAFKFNPLYGFHEGLRKTINWYMRILEGDTEGIDNESAS